MAAVDEATVMKMHSKVRWGNVEEVETLLAIAGTKDCQVRARLPHVSRMSLRAHHVLPVGMTSCSRPTAMP